MVVSADACACPGCQRTLVILRRHGCPWLPGWSRKQCIVHRAPSQKQGEPLHEYTTGIALVGLFTFVFLCCRLCYNCNKELKEKGEWKNFKPPDDFVAPEPPESMLSQHRAGAAPTAVKG